MKKLLFALCALVTFSFSSKAQDIPRNEESRNIVNEQTISLVHQLRDGGVGTEMKDWLRTDKPVPVLVPYLQTVQRYLDTDASDDEIRQGDNTSMISIIEDQLHNSTFPETPQDNPQAAARPFWKNLLNAVLNVGGMLLGSKFGFSWTWVDFFP